MLMIDQLNLNTLRIFECVFRHGNMTLAARELHITQAGVSQHIRNLEDFLGVALFDRVKQRLVPTSGANVLYERCVRGFSQLEQTLVQITGRENALTGTLRIGLPPEFAYNVALPILSRFLVKHPDVRVKFQMALAPKVNEMVLNGDVDFAFVDSLVLDKRITSEEVFGEAIVLCAHPDYMESVGKPSNQKDFFESLDYIAYLPDEPILRSWFAYHLTKRRMLLKIRAHAIDCQAVARLVLGRVGVSVLPSHLVTRLKREDGTQLYVFKGTKPALRNEISLAYLSGRSRPLVVDLALKYLVDELRKLR